MDIRRLTSDAEYRQVERLQKAIWGFPEREIIPLNELVVLQKHGGHVVGAFEGRRMVAFCFGQPGFRDGRAYHYSRMLGVLPRLRDSGLGRALKLMQRELVLAQGMDVMQWAFDPLQSRNAYFNIEKLGCVVREYFVNLYPGSASQFNRGLVPDRVTAEWPLDSMRARKRLDGHKETYDLEAYAPLIETRETKAGWRAPGDVLKRLPGPKVSIEIPEDINALKAKDVALAKRWRLRTRAAFQLAFEHGYVAHGFASPLEGDKRRSRYLLQKEVEA
jgi:predicted GNAT superfamily acetyltransferase